MKNLYLKVSATTTASVKHYKREVHFSHNGTEVFSHIFIAGMPLCPTIK